LHKALQTPDKNLGVQKCEQQHVAMDCRRAQPT
jgi:hypothetical protein